MPRQLFSSIKHIILFLMVLGFAASCGLPRGAPLTSEITKQKKGAPAEFAVYQVSRNLLPQIARWPDDPQARRHWLSHSAGVKVGIRSGDLINLVIWDSDSNSLLTSTEQKNVAIEGVIVSRSGSIFMPYLDKIHIAGLSADAARQKIQRQMEQIVPSAQVQLSVVPGARQSIDLVGGVANPGNFPLTDPDGHVTVLGLIAQGGGVAPTLENPQVTLTRAGRIYEISLKKLYENPKLDTILHGRDKVILASDDRFFRSLGASQKEAIVPFERETISALDAMSMVGGLRDARANPQGILILREYPPSAVKADGPSHQRVIFTVDLTSTDGLFSANKLLIHPGDTVMVTESPVVAAETIIGLFSNSFRAVSRAKGAF